MLKNRILLFINKLSAPSSEDPDTAFMEYMTKVILIVLSLVGIPFSLLSTVVWFFGFIPLDTLLILFCMNIFFIAGLWISQHRYWHISSLFPPMVMLFIAMYGNYIGGIDAPAMLIYVLAILLMAVARGARDMYITLVISLAAYLSIGVAHRYGYIVQLRSGETAFWNRVIIAIATTISISILVRFLIIQFKKALTQARVEIAERLNVEDELRNSERKYRELVQNANSLILRINMKGQITFCNEFAERFFGFKSDELIGMDIVGTIVPETDSSGNNLRQMIDAIMKSPDDFRFNENENMRRDGGRVWITWANRGIMDKHGRLKEVLCIGNDITAQKRALEEKEKMQAQLIQSQKMEAIGTLTSGLAHDFNNILSGIMGSLSLMEIIMREEEPSFMNKYGMYINTALDSSKRASSLIRQLLLLSRKQKITLTPVDINESIKHVTEICRNSFPKSVSLDIYYGDRPMSVMADEILIEQIFLNFCVNASHAMTIMREPGDKDGGVLKIRILSVAGKKPEALIPGEIAASGNFINIEISDTGIGMDEETQKRIFEPFFTTKKKESGTGLGLSMAYGFISQLGGFIEIKSEINRGSTFSIYLPEIESKPENADTGESSKNLTRGNETILIIDDEESILSVSGKILTSCGYTVLTASGGLDGLSLYKKNRDRIDAVLLDISMPLMSGLEVFEELKEINESVKVLISSGFAEDERITVALSEGAAGFIPKPYIAEELSSRIHEILSSRN